MATASDGRRRVLDGRVRTSAAIAVVGVGLLGEVAFGLGGDDALVVLGSSLLLSAAAAVSGALLGFLFGVPRAIPGTAPSRLPYAANTNLEQVSDWLTKILIGVGLTQIAAIRAAAGSLVSFVGPTFDPTPRGTIYASCVLLYFAVLGFFAGWLVTRVYLGAALSRADHDALDRFVEAQVAEDVGDEARAATLRQDALSLSEGAARHYESLRSLPSDRSRTAEMEATVETARKVATAARLSPEDVKAIFRTGADGDRVRALGLMQGDPRLADVDIALDGIGNSRSAFEQLHALRVMRGLVPDLSAADIERLRTVLAVQTGPAGHIHRDSNRWHLAQQIRQAAGLALDS